jgi:proteasome lid subunit RPN8/RPN11
MKWSNVKPDITASHVNEVVTGWSAIDLAKLVSSTDDCPFIIFPNHVRQKIMAHLITKKVELGGLLVGKVVSVDDLIKGLTMIVITDAFESKDFDSTSVSLSMSPSVWQSANKSSNAKNFVIGWYHSHPNLGAFFSGVDRKTQKDFFSSNYNLGLVIDPVRGEEKWFISADSIEVSPRNVFGELEELAPV